MATIGSLHDTRNFEEYLREQNSPSALGAVELLRAAFWALVYPMPAPALMLFHQALEVACKGLLQEVHILLAADPIDYKVTKFVVRDKLSTHRLGKNLTTTFTLEDFDPQRTCTFAEAWKRVRELVPLLPEYSKAGFNGLTKLRNGITHSGAELERESEYLEAILSVCLPMIENFYDKAYDGLKIDSLLGAPRMREIRVSQAYLAEIRKYPTLPREKLLHTYRLCSLARLADLGDPGLWMRDDHGDALAGFEFDDSGVAAQRRYVAQHPETWGRILDENLSLECLICGYECPFVGVDSDPYTLNEVRAIDPCAILCPRCRLKIPREYRVLAKLHFGPITEDRIHGGKAAWTKYIEPQ